jgi:GNAT superfamily N-acetyltransferase
MPHLRLSLPVEQFHRLPRHPAYKYELIEGETWISPRPRYYHAQLDLREFAPIDAAAVALRPLRPDDWDVLVPVFASAFFRHEPFASTDDEGRQEAAVYSLNQTRSGEDGPLIEKASFVAEDEQGHPVGAVLVTLVPKEDPEGLAGLMWERPPPEGCVERREGWAHLTWIFVAHYSAGHGVGTALLAAAARELLALGYDALLTTFLAGNVSSMLWHWRQGFRLLGYPGSYRRFKREP